MYNYELSLRLLRMHTDKNIIAVPTQWKGLKRILIREGRCSLIKFQNFRNITEPKRRFKMLKNNMRLRMKSWKRVLLLKIK